MTAPRTVQLLDPREKAPDRRHGLSPRVQTLEGKRIGFSLGTWRNYRVFVDHLERLMKERFPTISTSRIESLYNTRKGEKLREFEEFSKDCDVVVAGLAA